MQVDGAKSPDAVFEDVKAIFAQLNTQVHSYSCSLFQLLSSGNMEGMAK